MAARLSGLPDELHSIRGRLMIGTARPWSQPVSVRPGEYTPPPPPPPGLNPTMVAHLALYTPPLLGGTGERVPNLDAATVWVSNAVGPAPLGVHFALRFPTQQDSTSFILFGTAVWTFSQQAGENYAFRHLDKLTNETANTAFGPYVGHVYEGVGQHQWSVTLHYPGLASRTITHANGCTVIRTWEGATNVAANAIDVRDPNEWFDSAPLATNRRTWFFSPSAYASQTAMRTAMAVHYPAASTADLSRFFYGSAAQLAACMTAASNAGTDAALSRVLIEAGTTTTLVAGATSLRLSRVWMDRIGTGANPVLHMPFDANWPEPANDQFGGGCFVSGQRFAINNVTATSFYDPANPPDGAVYQLGLHGINITGTPYGSQIFRTKLRGWCQNINVVNEPRGLVVSDSDLDEWYNYAWFGPWSDGAIVGTTMKQKLGTVNNRRRPTSSGATGNASSTHMGSAYYTSRFSWQYEIDRNGPIPKAGAPAIPPGYEAAASGGGGWGTHATPGAEAWWQANWQSFTWADVDPQGKIDGRSNEKAWDNRLDHIYRKCAIHGPMRFGQWLTRSATHQVEMRSMNGWPTTKFYNAALPWDQQPPNAYQVQPCVRAYTGRGTIYPRDHSASWWRVYLEGGNPSFQQQAQRYPDDPSSDRVTLGYGAVYDGMTIVSGRLPDHINGVGGGMTVVLGRQMIRNSVFYQPPGDQVSAAELGSYDDLEINTRSEGASYSEQAGPDSEPSYGMNNTEIFATANPTGVYPSAPRAGLANMRPFYEWNQITLLAGAGITITDPAATPPTYTGLVDTSPILGDINVPHRPGVGSSALGAAQLITPTHDAAGAVRPTPAAVGAFEEQPETSPQTDANVTAINADGWSVTYTSPPTFDPVADPKYVVASRQGFDTTGAATTHEDAIILTQRVRQAYPNNASLSTDRVAMSDYLYSTDTVTGKTNNSAETSPKPVANWVAPDRLVVGNTLPAANLEIVAFHRNARNGEEVACVEWIISDGTNTVTAKASASVVSGRTGDRQAVIVYRPAADVDISTLTDGATLTVNAKVYPWIGGAASVLNSADSSVAREFSPRYFRRDTALLAAPRVAYVRTVANGGNDATGVVSTTPATASANPFATVLAAINAHHTAGGMDGAIIYIGNDGGTPFVLGSTAATRTQSHSALTITREPGVARANARVSFGAASFRPRLGTAGGWLRFLDVGVTRTGTSNFSGEAGSLLSIYFDGVTFDNATNNAAIYNSNSDGYFYNVDFQNVGTTLLNAATREHRIFRGCAATGANNIEGWLVVGCQWTGTALVLTRGTRTESGSIRAYNFLTGPSAGAPMVSYGNSETVVGCVMAQNVIEYISATAQPAIRVSGDSATGGNTHIILHHNTFAGFFINGRGNLFYEDGTTARTSKLMSCKGNIHVQINTKGDVFVTNGARVGNWPYLYGVGCEGEFSQFIDADSGGIGAAFAQAYPGLRASIGTSSTVRNNPIFTDDNATSSGPTAGAGGGTYTIASNSPAKARVAPVLRFDLAGNARSTTLASAGAYE